MGTFGGASYLNQAKIESSNLFQQDVELLQAHLRQLHQQAKQEASAKAKRNKGFELD